MGLPSPSTDANRGERRAWKPIVPLAVLSVHSSRLPVDLLDLLIECQHVVDDADAEQTTGEEIQNAREDLAHVEAMDAEQSQQ